MVEALDDESFGTVVADRSGGIRFGGSPFGHPPYVLTEIYAGLSTFSGAGRYLFLYGEPVGTRVTRVRRNHEMGSAEWEPLRVPPHGTGSISDGYVSCG